MVDLKKESKKDDKCNFTGEFYLFVNMSRRSGQPLFLYIFLGIMLVFLLSTYAGNSFPDSVSFSGIDEVHTVKDTRLVKSGKGEIEFSEAVSFSGLNLAKNIFIEERLIGVDTQAEGMKRLDVPATLTFYNIPPDYVIYKGNKACGNECSNEIYNEETGMLVFDVTGFSNYTVLDGPGECGKQASVSWGACDNCVE